MAALEDIKKHKSGQSVGHSSYVPSVNTKPVPRDPPHPPTPCLLGSRRAHCPSNPPQHSLTWSKGPFHIQVLPQVALNCVAAVVIGQGGAAESIREGIGAGIPTGLWREKMDEGPG